MNITAHIKNHKLEAFLLAIMIAIAIFFRFWQIRDYIVFLGDEGRDAIIMRNMILTKRPVFLGPTASVGGFYLGPIYYWMAAPFLALFRFDPVGPSYMVALFGLATVVLLYKFLRDTVGPLPAILAGFLYSTAPLIVRYSRSSWNPNPLPFFSLLLIYSIYLAIKKKNQLYFILTGLCFGIAIQLHYLAIMLIPVSALIIALNLPYRRWFQAFAYAVAGAFVTFSPFFFFEVKHGFPNFRTISEFVTRKSTHGYNSPNLIWVVSNFGNMLLEYISLLKATVITKIVFWVLSLGGIYGLVKNWKDKDQRLIFSIGVIWFVGGLFFLRFYSGQIFDYYYGFMFPAPFFLAGLIFSIFKSKYFKAAAILFTAAAVFWFAQNGFYKNPPNRLIKQTQDVANFVIDKSGGKPYNFALISDHNSDHAYRYFLEIENHKPTDLEKMITDQLLVVCEAKKCSPLGNPSWEIAGFGRGEIEGEWELPDIGITVIKLHHWPGAPNPAGHPAVKG